MKYVDEKQNPYLFQRINKELRIFNNAIYINSTFYFMWEEGINTKPQIYYNNNNAGTPQASKRKKKAIQIEKWKTHTQNK